MHIGNQNNEVLPPVEGKPELNPTPSPFILCEECEGKGQIFDDGIYRECPVCDGEPKITFATVKSYAQQIDRLAVKAIKESKHDQ
jgi:RecJ-like exonuclease